jgi:hypothetical protein
MFKSISNSFKKLAWQTVHGVTGLRPARETHYEDWIFFGAAYELPLAALQSKLPSRSLQPIESSPGMGTLEIVAFEFKKVRELPPYNEVSFQVPVRYVGPDAPAIIHAYSHIYLAVDNEAARWPGIKIHGMPGFLADIACRPQGDDRVCELGENGRQLLELGVRLELGREILDNWRYWGKIENDLVLSEMEIYGQYGERTDDLTSTLTLGDHPIAGELRALGLPRAPVMEMFGYALSSTLFAPRVVIAGP